MSVKIRRFKYVSVIDGTKCHGHYFSVTSRHNYVSIFVVWCYLLLFAAGRTTYFRVYPESFVDIDYENGKKRHKSYTRFHTINRPGRWIKPNIDCESSVDYGFGLAHGKESDRAEQQRTYWRAQIARLLDSL